MTGAVEHVGAAVPPQLARQVRADGRHRGDAVPAAEQKCTNAAGRDPLALALDQLRERRNVNPPTGNRVDRFAANAPGAGCRRLHRPADQATRDRARGHAETGDERRPAREPMLIWRSFESLLQALPEGRVHALLALTSC